MTNKEQYLIEDEHTFKIPWVPSHVEILIHRTWIPTIIRKLLPEDYHIIEDKEDIIITLIEIPLRGEEMFLNIYRKDIY